MPSPIAVDATKNFRIASGPEGDIIIVAFENSILTHDVDFLCDVYPAYNLFR